MERALPVVAGLPEPDVEYFKKVIMRSALALRRGESVEAIAVDLEDSTRWSRDPQTCQHPFWVALTGGSTACRTCGISTDHIDAQGADGAASDQASRTAVPLPGAAA